MRPPGDENTTTLLAGDPRVDQVCPGDALQIARAKARRAVDRVRHCESIRIAARAGRILQRSASQDGAVPNGTRVRTLRELIDSLAGHKDQPAVEAALDAWFDEAKRAHWQNTADIKRSYATASIVTAERVVFNIKGNAYRLVVAIDFEKAIVWIKWVGTHRDYDQIDVTKVEYGE